MGNLLNLELKNVANTNAQYWGGRLLSLWEAGMPHEMDPDSLDTLGPSTLGGFSSIGRKLEEPDRYDGVGQPVDTQSGDAVNSLLGFGGMAFSAHPHYDLGSRTKPRGGEGEESTIDRRLLVATSQFLRIRTLSCLAPTSIHAGTQPAVLSNDNARSTTSVSANS